MEIISLHNKCYKRDRQVLQPKTLSKPDEASPKLDKPKKVSEPIDDPSEEGQKPKKALSDGKKTAKKVKKTQQPKKVPKSPESIDSSKEEEEKEPSKDDKKKKMSPLLWLKEGQNFFDLRKESKNLTIKKNVEKVVFMAGPYKGYELSYVVLYGTKYLKRVFKMSGLEKKAKHLIKQALTKA